MAGPPSVTDHDYDNANEPFMTKLLKFDNLPRSFVEEDSHKTMLCIAVFC